MRNPRYLLRELALLLCAWTACWPLQELVRSDRALLPAVVVVVLVVATGTACRLRHLSGIVTLLLQLSMLVVGVVFGLLIRGISPAPANLASLTRALNRVIHVAIAPLPPLPCVILMVLVGSGLVALVVDYVGGTAAMCVFAAVPLVAPFLLSAAAIGHVMPVHYFIAAAVAWALLLSQSGPHGSPVRRSRPSSLVAVLMAASAVLATLLVAPHVPHRTPPELSQGASAGVDASVDFSRSLDLSKSLHSTNSSPVLRYDTSAPLTSPLRVTTSSEYADGIWRATALAGPFTKVHAQSSIPDPGLAPSTPRTTIRTSVIVNGIHPPLIAAPAPIAAANFGQGNGTFRIAANSGVPILSKPTRAYGVLSTALAANARPSSDEPVSPATATVTTEDLDVSVLPAGARKGIDTLLHDATSKASTRFDKAVAIQRYLRKGGGFRYSLNAPNVIVDNQQLDPLSAFLRTRSGYCTQFATTMIMAARESGIPARIAIGFLPGRKLGPHYEVRASDAHAWPELYFPGMGWTRFDPTPPSRSGSAPSYAPDTTAKASPAPHPTTRPRPTPTHTPTPTPKAHHVTPHKIGFAWAKAVLLVCAALIIVGLLLSVLPLAGRLERGRLLKRAGSEREQAEGHWHAMRWSLADLGLALPLGRSPQEDLAAFRRLRPDRSPEFDDAFRRATEEVENSRYSPRPSRPVGSATHRVITAARQDASWWRKCRALLLPASGLEFFRRNLRRKR